MPRLAQCADHLAHVHRLAVVGADAMVVEDDLTEMPPRLTADPVREGLARYLGWLRTEVGRVMGGGTK